MKSFPSAFNRGGNSNKFTGKHAIDGGLEQLGSIAAKTYPELDNIQAKNLNYTTLTKKFLFTQTNTSEYDRYIPNTLMHSGNKVIFENPQFIPSWVLTSMNNYRIAFNNPVKNKFDVAKSGKTSTVSISSTKAAPSIFNPLYMVQAVGFTSNVPLLIDYRAEKQSTVKNVGDCRIERLIADSAKAESPLGMARYRLVDFMFCKDLGKVSNNHLITLRKFPFPVDDHIFKYATPSYASEHSSLETPGDVGHLCAWFGTDDNKLEDICKFETEATWKAIENKIQEIDSKENAAERGPIGKVLNAINPAFNRYADATGNGGHTILADLGSSLIPGLVKESTDNNDVLRMSADNNKVYTPKNTVQDNHIYEGKLVLKQEITVTFSYKLRAYENINPKSAFLDLMGNILEVTFQRGHYWKGEARIIGSPQNIAGWRKANYLIDGAWNKLGGFIEAMAAGTLDFNNILGSISNMVGEIANKAANMAKEVINNPTEAISNLSSALKTLDKATGFSNGMKALLKNSLGRPAMYAMDSLIEGSNMGPWHLTIGNPYNPIMSIGNLILTNSSVQHSGALGVDDFPSEIKVTCSLKPARSRDVTGISRYYTQGLNALYMHSKRGYLEDYYSLASGYSSKEVDAARKKAEEASLKQETTGGTTKSGEQNSNSGNETMADFTTENYDDGRYTIQRALASNSGSDDSEWHGFNNPIQMQIYQLGNASGYQLDIAENEVA